MGLVSPSRRCICDSDQPFGERLQRREDQRLVAQVRLIAELRLGESEDVDNVDNVANVGARRVGNPILQHAWYLKRLMES